MPTHGEMKAMESVDLFIYHDRSTGYDEHTWAKFPAS